MVRAANMFPGRMFWTPHHSNLNTWKEGVAVDLDVSWDNLVLVWVVISFNIQEYWG